jgi:mRNA interferase MazF
MVIRRGEVWWAALDTPMGSEPGYRRPVVILQINDFNDSPIRTVIAVTMSSNLKLAAAPGNVLCRRHQTKLSKDSVANVSQVATLDKTRLLQRVSALPSHLFSRLEEGLRLVMGL